MTLKSIDCNDTILTCLEMHQQLRDVCISTILDKATLDDVALTRDYVAHSDDSVAAADNTQSISMQLLVDQVSGASFSISSPWIMYHYICYILYVYYLSINICCTFSTKDTATSDDDTTP